ncbi:MAG: hypothetical protein PVG45_02055 [Gammaproteobacteria bacterium]
MSCEWLCQATISRIDSYSNRSATRYSFKEAIAHSVTHGISLLPSAPGLVTLVLYSSQYGDV